MKIKVSTALALLLGFVFIFSGTVKLLDVQSFILMVSGYPLFSSIAPLAMIIPPLEILLGVGLILLMNTRLLGLVTAGTLAVFTTIYLYGYYVAGITDCGCFGDLGFFDSSPTALVIRNLTLIAAALFVWKTGTLTYLNKKMKAKQYSLYAGAVVFLALAFISSKNPLLTAAPVYQEMDVDITTVVDFANMDADKTYLLFVYSMTCPACWNSVDIINQYQESDMVDDVIGLTLGRKADVQEFNERFNLKFTTYMINRGLFQQLATVTPTTYLIKNNVVVDELGYPVPTPDEYAEKTSELN
ncbi:MAG: MauE/DoxX family redox-associated membrane protein [Balneolales bacterium]